MGVIALYFIDYVVEVSLPTKYWRLVLHPLIPYPQLFIFITDIFLSGARSALPMGVAPDAMVGYL
jgi:hypothetical protein